MLKHHLLVVGAAGSGKSYLLCQILDEIVRHPCQLVLIDPKRGPLKRYRGNVHTIAYSSEPAGNYEAVRMAHGQMRMRQIEVDRAGDDVYEYTGAPTYVVIDEAGALLMERAHGLTDMLARIAMMGRGSRVFLVWCTQVPSPRNIPEQIDERLDDRICLRLADPSQARYVFGPYFTSGRPSGRPPLQTRGTGPAQTYGTGIVKTPDMPWPRRMSTGEMLDALGVRAYE